VRSVSPNSLLTAIFYRTAIIQKNKNSAVIRRINVICVLLLNGAVSEKNERLFLRKVKAIHCGMKGLSLAK
jgi:hypothetical protein